MKLNGWQRLWVVLSVLLLIWIAVNLYSKLPGDDTARRNARYEALASIRPSNFDILSDCMKEAGAGASLNLDNSWYQLCDERSRLFTPEDRTQFERKTEELLPKMRSDLRAEQAKDIGIMTLVWAVVSGLTYFIGWVIAWVIRGFKQNKS